MVSTVAKIRPTRPVQEDPHGELPSGRGGGPATDPGELVASLGGHPIRELGLGELELDVDPEDDDALGAWWSACCVLDARRAGEDAGVAAWRSLARRIAPGVATWAETEPAQLAAWLEEAGHPRAEAVAAVLHRGSRALLESHGGSLSRLARGSEDLETLAGALARLTPGFGRAAVFRFLQPLREVWDAASELPLDPAARAAAVHLGWLDDGEDDEGGPGTLSARLRSMDCSMPLHDVEAALARLGRRACVREQVSRCPLGDACPRR